MTDIHTSYRLPPKICFFDVPCSICNFDETLQLILSLTQSKGTPLTVYTPNVHHIYLYHTDSEFQLAYKNCTLALIDGMPIAWTARIFREKRASRVPGSDLFEQLLPLLVNAGKKVFLLGAKEGVAQTAARKLCGDHVIGKNIFTLSPPFNFEKDPELNTKVIEEIRNISPDLLFVALGSPRQEIWLDKTINELNTTVGIAVGASFDFVAGTQKRAPKIIQKICFEWLFRLIQNPLRLGSRYLISNTFFLYLLLKRIIFFKSPITPPKEDIH